MPFVALRVSRAALSKKSPAFLRIERKKSEEGEREKEGERGRNVLQICTKKRFGRVEGKGRAIGRLTGLSIQAQSLTKVKVDG